MALVEADLRDNIIAVLESPPGDVTDTDDFATKVADHVDTYLATLTFLPLPEAGVNPTASSGGPLPDPAFVGTALTQPKILLLAPAFRAGLKSDLAANEDGRDPPNYDEAVAGYVADMATMTATKGGDSGYEGTGVSVCPDGPDIEAAFAVGLAGGTAAEVGTELASQIHNATVSTIYTGTYGKTEGGFTMSTSSGYVDAPELVSNFQ